MVMTSLADGGSAISVATEIGMARRLEGRAPQLVKGHLR